MNISHAAIWVKNLESMKEFYEQYFDGLAGKKYSNPEKGFQSYFLSFHSGARLELMAKDGVHAHVDARASDEFIGFAHLAFSVGSPEAVDSMTDNLSKRGVAIISGPRKTGDGYYESVIGDPEGNRIEITD
jgi:lactoylglutathione lyase